MKIFYDPRQTVKDNTSFSPSARKPALVVESFLAGGLPVEIHSFPPCDPNVIALAHDEEYVAGVLHCEKANGFGNTLESVAKSLPWTTGSMVAAAVYAWKNKTAACSPTSGFHHACFHNGGGFCTFNGLVIAAQVLYRMGVDRVGIIDIDMHYGNGTDDIIDECDLGYIQHYTFGQHRYRSGDEFLERLEEDILPSFDDCKVIIYQAGADPHVKDPLGGALTDEQLRKRDEIIFNYCKRRGIGIAWNLAGGYQDDIRRVLDIHDATAKECIKVFG